MKHKTDKEYINLGLKTALQWANEKKLPNENADGLLLWCNPYHQNSATYYLPSEVHNASDDELAVFLEPYRERKKSNREARIERENRRFKRELEERYQQGKEEATYAISIACKERIYPAFCKGIVPKTVELKNRTIVFDVETTGLSAASDEVLQISIIDGNGDVLLNSYVKPYFTYEWDEAEKINGITKDMVENAPFAHELMPLVQGIFQSSDKWVAYNANFDLSFLESWGVRVEKNEIIEDVMLDFAPLYGEWHWKYGNWKWQTLSTCAFYFDYEFNNAHDSLEDVRATLHCFKKMQKMKADGTYFNRVDENEEEHYYNEHPYLER